MKKNKFACQAGSGYFKTSRDRDWSGCMGILFKPKRKDPVTGEYQFELTKKQTRRLIRRLQESLDG